jgi:iron complex transport system substrate-binding protein
MIADAAYLISRRRGKSGLGWGDAGQGIGQLSSNVIDPDYEQKATLESAAGAEQVAALQPDLVILKSYLADTIGAPIEAIGIPAIYVDFETPEQYSRDLAILGKVFGDEARAAEVADFFQSRMDEKRSDGAGSPKTACAASILYRQRRNVALQRPAVEQDAIPEV